MTDNILKGNMIKEVIPKLIEIVQVYVTITLLNKERKGRGNMNHRIAI